MTLRLNRTFLFLTVLAILGGEWAPAAAQTLRLRQVGTNQNKLTVQIGQIVNIEVFADLQQVESAGISFFAVTDQFRMPASAWASSAWLPGSVVCITCAKRFRSHACWSACDHEGRASQGSIVPSLESEGGAPARRGCCDVCL